MSVLVAAPKTFPHQWSGEQFSSDRIAIDCETTLANYPAVPTLVLTSVSDGVDSYIIREVDELRSFLELHSDREFIAHNCAFDHAVIVKALGESADGLQGSRDKAMGNFDARLDWSDDAEGLD